MTATADVVVVGGGPSGVAAALGCARRGLEVVLLDKARFPRDKPCGEGLLPTAVCALDRLGLLSRIRGLGCPLEGITFAIPSGPSATSPFCDSRGQSTFGLGMARRTLDAVLVEAARTEPGVTVVQAVESRGLLHEADRVCGVQTNVGTLRARVVVAADGLRSSLRRQLGLDRSNGGSPRLGLRAHFRVPQLPFGRSVHVLIAPDLEYYVTPVGLHELQVAALGTRRAFARARLTASGYAAHLRATALGPRLEGAELLDRPLGAGPMRQRASSLVTDGAILVGDAAGYLDAITGEGVGLALETGQAAATVVVDALAVGEPTAHALSPYVAAHARIVRDAERLTRLVLWLTHSPWLARRAVAALHRSPRLFRHLLQVQAGAPLSTVRPIEWAQLVAG